MYILMSDNICMEPEVLRIIAFIKTLLDVIKILVPIILIVLGMLDFAKAAFAGKESQMEEYKSKFIRRLFAAVLIFFIPACVDFVFKNLDNTDIFENACWSSATPDNIAKLTEEAKSRRETEKAQYQEWAKNNIINIEDNGGGSSNTTTDSSDDSPSSNNTYDKLRSDVVKYATGFVGHPYVYGGTKLCTNWRSQSGCGVDCSAFIQNVYKKFNYNLPRTTGPQSNYKNGKKIMTFANNYSNLKPGDLLFYKGNDGTVANGHVTMYIGNQQVVHASGKKTGVIISPISYRKPAWAVRIIKG